MNAGRLAGLMLATVALAACSSGSGRAKAAPALTTTTMSPAPSSTAPTSTVPATSVPASVAVTTTVAPLPIAAFQNWRGIRPSAIYFSGDSGDIVTGIRWSSWTAASAMGQGLWGYDDCNPNCAQGTVTQYPTSLRLDNPRNGQFTEIVETQTGPHGTVQRFTLPSRFIGART